MDSTIFVQQRNIDKRFLIFKIRTVKRNKLNRYMYIYIYISIRIHFIYDNHRRAKFIHQEFRRTGFVSAVQHFVVDGRDPIMVTKTHYSQKMEHISLTGDPRASMHLLLIGHLVVMVKRH